VPVWLDCPSCGTTPVPRSTAEAKLGVVQGDRIATLEIDDPDRAVGVRAGPPTALPAQRVQQKTPAPKMRGWGLEPLLVGPGRASPSGCTCMHIRLTLYGTPPQHLDSADAVSQDAANQDRPSRRPAAACFVPLRPIAVVPISHDQLRELR
jgi:hypothetical protein